VATIDAVYGAIVAPSRCRPGAGYIRESGAARACRRAIARRITIFPAPELRAEFRMADTERPWSVPIRVEEVPEAGRRVELAADEPVRRSVAEAAGVNAVTRLDATFDLARHGRSGLHVTGGISATVRQTCVVTLEPILNEVVEPVDLVFVSGNAHPKAAEQLSVESDPPEPMFDGIVDLGAVATEFLILGIDPYPRKSGVVFEAPAIADRDATPFAALAALKKKNGTPER
jgi:uncharacterized metal-binding protein YceD (DUF177 family)